jgi:hypothetical protein
VGSFWKVKWKFCWNCKLRQILLGFDQVKEDEMSGTCCTHGREEKFTQNICRKILRERSLGKTRRRWVHNIIMDLREIWWKGVDRVHLSQDKDQWQALVETIMNFRVPKTGGENFSTSSATISFSFSTELVKVEMLHSNWWLFTTCYAASDRLDFLPINRPTIIK